MCDTYEPPRQKEDGTMSEIKPLPTNTRFECAQVMEKAKAQEPWFGIEQVCLFSLLLVLCCVLVFASWAVSEHDCESHCCLFLHSCASASVADR